MKKCEKCGAEYDKEYKFCPACGGNLLEAPDLCPNCGLELTADYKFCPKCGEPIAQNTIKGKRKETIAKPSKTQSKPQISPQVVSEKKTKSKTKKLVIIGCAVVVAICAIVYLNISSPQSIYYNYEGPTEGLFEGIVIEAGETLPISELNLDCEELTQKELNNLQWDPSTDEYVAWVKDGEK